ncbi:hypothetical protein H9651_04345 [Microbacterium sp. Sa4CUA7]|uniref:Integral membrane protein n=1 Tax=Microbacterium pullorum TaxID=2762236 RepID=A0ABR8S038_9MICO|nr:DUF6264 family protein [Microbacterium pullorum]MBD7956856.1 hypothetical protein [Microbacterium pullorum]
MSEAEPRPRPQYGEYATPEEQRARIAHPYATDALSAGVAPETVAPAYSGPVAPATTSAARPTRTADRIITFVLLGYGLLTVLVSAPQMIDVAAFAQTLFQTLGVDAVMSDPAGLRGWGIAGAAVIVVGWLLTAWLSWRSLAARRLTWWIPLVGGIVFNFFSGTLMVVLIMSDPAAWEALQRTLGG